MQNVLRGVADDHLKTLPTNRGPKYLVDPPNSNQIAATRLAK